MAFELQSDLTKAVMAGVVGGGASYIDGQMPQGLSMWAPATAMAVSGVATNVMGQAYRGRPAGQLASSFALGGYMASGALLGWITSRRYL